MTATQHFRQRVAERIGPDVDADTLAAAIVTAIRRERTDLVTFVARINRDGLRLFRFRTPQGRAFYAAVNTVDMACVTVMPPGFVVPRQGKGRITLRDVDL